MSFERHPTFTAFQHSSLVHFFHLKGLPRVVSKGFSLISQAALKQLVISGGRRGLTNFKRTLIFLLLVGTSVLNTKFYLGGLNISRQSTAPFTPLWLRAYYHAIIGQNLFSLSIFSYHAKIELFHKKTIKRHHGLRFAPLTIT